MKVLLAFLVTFSIFAAENFNTDKENVVKRLHASNAPKSVITCAENAKTRDELNACEKVPARHASGHHGAPRTKHI